MYYVIYGPLHSEVKITRNGTCALFTLSYSIHCRVKPRGAEQNIYHICMVKYFVDKSDTRFLLGIKTLAEKIDKQPPQTDGHPFGKK